MFTGVWLDTAIGVALFFLAMSFAVSAAVEGIAQLLAMRARTLRQGIESLLNSVAGSQGATKDLLAEIYGHSLIKGLADNRNLPWVKRIGNSTIPSYIPSRIFATVLLDVTTRSAPADVLSQCRQDFTRVLKATGGSSDRHAALDKLGAAFAAAGLELAPAIKRQLCSINARSEALQQALTRAQTAGDTAWASRAELMLKAHTADLETFRNETLPEAGQIETSTLPQAVNRLGAMLTAQGDLAADDVAFVEAAADRLVSVLSQITSGVDRALSGADHVVDAIAIPELRDALRALIGDGRHSVDELRATASQWFDDSMDRVSGWYKRWVQFLSFVLGFAIAATINADAINLVSTIATNEKLRSELASLAQTTIGLETEHERVQLLRERLDGLPVGWYQRRCAPTGPETSARSTPDPKLRTDASDQRCAMEPASFAWISDPLVKLQFAPTAILGWLITALAVKLGAPFWFGLLSSLVSLRGTGKVPPPAAAASPLTGGGAAP